jgi:thiamine-phosphate pyrophosphorylase
MRIDYSLYLVADAKFAAGRDLVLLIESAVRGGVTVVQLRGKHLSYADFVELGRQAAAALKKSRIPLIINDRADVALACGAAGVHFGQDDMPLSIARKVLAQKMVIGISANTREQALEAERRGADYIGLGPIYATASKETALPLVGPEGIRRVKARVRIPVVAIGGITFQNAPAVAAAGADGIAVISAILGRPDPERAARRLKDLFRGGTPAEGHHA